MIFPLKPSNSPCAAGRTHADSRPEDGGAPKDFAATSGSPSGAADPACGDLERGEKLGKKLVGCKNTENFVC